MITSKHIDSNGTVHLWDLGPTKVRMAAVDARHAIDTEPGRWALVDPESPDQYVAGGESAAPQNVDLAASAAHEEKPATERDSSEFGGESAI